jgi:CheY-like chemotaxis protein
MSNLLVDTPLQPDQREFAETIRNSAEALLTIINDILDFSKLEAGKLKFEETDFNLITLVEETVKLLAPRATDKGIRLEFSIATDLPPLLRGDPGRLRQVLLNLIGNGIKFTDQGGVFVRVTREASSAPTDQRSLCMRIEVEDTGIGISPVEASQLFLPFSQADASTTRRFGGTGLGLAISRQIVELMGGKIGQRSQAGHGSVFWFTMTLLIASSTRIRSTPSFMAAKQKQPTDTSALNGLRVLVAEDNAVNQRLIEVQLKRFGCTMQCVENGLLVIEALRHNKYDLILMDCQMPELDGYETTRRLRTTEACQLPIIAMTANAMLGDREKCLEAGMDDYISKPVRLPDLQETLLRRIANRPPRADASSNPTAPSSVAE